MRLGYFNPQAKLLYHTKRISEWLSGKNTFPILIEWFPSNVCNQHCDFCSFKDYKLDKDFLDANIMCNELEAMSRDGLKAINITGGGEPLLYPYINSMMRQAHAVGIQLGLFTNGSLLTPQLMETILKTCTWCRFSIDAGTTEVYKATRKSDDFCQVWLNVSTMVSMKKQLKSKCDIGVGFVITPRNFLTMRQFEDWGVRTGVDYIQFKPMIQRFSAQEDKLFWDMVRPELERLSKNPKVMVNLYKYRDLETSIGRPYNKCYGCQFVPCISGSKVYPCNYMTFPKYELGDLNHQTFLQIWNSDKRKQICDTLPQKECQLYCKNNEINKILFNIKENINVHQNFL